MLKYIFFILFLASFFSLNGQYAPVVDVNFDACVALDVGTTNSNVVALGNPGCECGLVNDAFEFDGESDAIVFDKSVNSIFNQDFTIEFYFSVYNSYDLVDILSFKNECISDSSFSLQYLPSIHEVRFYANQFQSKSIEIDVPIQDDKCWHHIAIVRKDFDYYIFLDGKLKGSKMADRQYVFGEDNILSIANNPCDTISTGNFNRFKGRIDQFKVYDYALSDIQLSEIELPFDMILNPDTTIFLGSSIQVDMGPTCADNFSWTNKFDLNNPDTLLPLITPEKSTIYYIYFQMKGKSCYDSLYIHVQNKDSLECQNLLLPNSFTPNGDGLNDRFGISNKFIIEELKSFDIYNKWGTRVFHTTNEDDSWDGNYNNEKINPSKLVYKVIYICKEKEYVKQGIINMLR